jgi:predicted RNA binding protein YcfA (HicA-like mRNA interferase family)
MASDVRFADIRRMLERHGWELVRISGSHHIFAKDGEVRLISLPVHRGKVKHAYVRRLARDFGIEV